MGREKVRLQMVILMMAIGKNKKHGKVMFMWANGNDYDGDYKDDKMHEKGKYTWANGSVYDGNWKDDKMLK